MVTLLSYNLIMFCKIETQILIELLKVNYYLQKKNLTFYNHEGQWRNWFLIVCYWKKPKQDITSEVFSM